ncbi:hypothetical protein [Pseudonocardia kunmingensis]|nr:hypothetical protein [Pseudonocardia kunmingensis]
MSRYRVCCRLCARGAGRDRVEPYVKDVLAALTYASRRLIVAIRT